jgi:hypothetical protein
MAKFEKQSETAYLIVKNGVNQVVDFVIAQPNQEYETLHITIEPYETREEWLSVIEASGYDLQTLEEDGRI